MSNKEIRHPSSDAIGFEAAVSSANETAEKKPLVTFLPRFKVNIMGHDFWLPGIKRHVSMRQEVLKILLERQNDNEKPDKMTQEELKEELTARGFTVNRPDLSGPTSILDIGVHVKGKKLVAHDKPTDSFYINPEFFKVLEEHGDSSRKIGPRPPWEEKSKKDTDQLFEDKSHEETPRAPRQPTLLELAAQKELNRDSVITQIRNDDENSPSEQDSGRMPGDHSPTQSDTYLNQDPKYWDRRIRQQERKEVPLEEIVGNSPLDEDTLSRSAAEKILIQNDDGCTDSVDDRLAASKILALLDPGERYIIRKHYGLDGEKPQTLRDIGKEFGVSHEAIRLVEQAAFSRIRKQQ